MSIGKAQAKALADGFLDNLGSAPPTEGFPVIEAILSEVAKDLIDTAAKNLQKAKAVSTGELITALTFQVEILGKTYVLSAGYDVNSNAAKYWDYRNQGVKGVINKGKAPKSPYSFKNLRVSKAHALAIHQWLQHNSKGATNVKKPISRLESKRKGLLGAVKKRDNEMSLAYAVASSIKRSGIAPSNYFSNAIKSAMGKDMIGALETALAGDVRIKIRQFGDNL